MFLILVTLVLEQLVQVLIVRSDAEMAFLVVLNNAIMEIKMAVQLIVFLIQAILALVLLDQNPIARLDVEMTSSVELKSVITATN